MQQRAGPYHIGFGGSLQMQHGQDVARVLVAAADSGYQGAVVLNLPTPAIQYGDDRLLHRGWRRPARRGRSRSTTRHSHSLPSLQIDDIEGHHRRRPRDIRRGWRGFNHSPLRSVCSNED